MLALKPIHKKKIEKISRPRLVLYLALATGVLTLGLWLLENVYEPYHSPASAVYYKSLDLSKARHATYANTSIATVKDLDTTEKVRQRLVSFNVPKDSLKEFGLMTLPITSEPKGGYPVIILCHGYANPANYSTLNSYIEDMEFYSQHGFVVVKPDYRGQGFSFTAGTPDGAYYSMSYNTDVLSLMAAVKQTSYLNAKDINLWGHSMGGYIALRAAVLSPDIKNLILVSAPVGNVQDMFSKYTAISDTANSVANEIRDNELIAVGTPLGNPSYWNKTSPLNYLSRVKSYVQIYVGGKDAIVPPEFSAELNAALNKAHKPHSYHVYVDGQHGLLSQRTQLWPSTLEALDKK